MQIGNICIVNKGAPLFIIAGPCAIESEDICSQIAEEMKKVCKKYNIPYIFKASFDKANRTSSVSYRGPGIERGLQILEKIKNVYDVPVLTDVHTIEQVEIAAQVVDVLQTPAFLCRQTDFICACAQSGKIVNLKKGQFLSPYDMKNVLDKAIAAAKEVGLSEDRFLLCERGCSFGYGNLITDMRALSIMRGMGVPVVFDATHSVQLPGGNGKSSGGQRQFVPVLARSAVAAGISGLFFETHPNPAMALSDGPNMLPLSYMDELIGELVQINSIVKSFGYLEDRL